MKYANIVFDGDRTGSVNIGDDLQIVAIENLYKYMGINYSEIIRIGLSELASYDGDYVILPVSFPLYGYREGLFTTMFSPKIIPVFLGLSIISGNIPDQEVEYLRRFEPIGCRDKYTLDLLWSKNIMAYLNGCMSVTMPKVSVTENNNKIFLVDIPKSYFEFIPEDIINCAENITHIKESSDNPESDIKLLLNRYATEAKLIITTRLHCAWPCAGMGIPVIMMKDRPSFRFSALSKYLHIYTKEEFGIIDWNPKPVDLEQIKEKLLHNAASRLRYTYDYYCNMFDISHYYESGITKEYNYIEHYTNVIEFIESRWNREDSFRYAVWGLTHKADLICSYLKDNYPNAELVAAYDAKRQVNFHGINSMPISEASDIEDVFVFVTTATLDKIATDYFKNIGKNNFFCSVDVESYGMKITT